MLLNNETDYAIRIVNCLSAAGKITDAGSISEQTGVTPRFALKILHRLVGAGIVKSFKGAKGGYVLARPGSEITLLEVVETMCGPITVSRCQNDAGECTHPNGLCRYRDTFSDVSSYMVKKFKSVTF